MPSFVTCISLLLTDGFKRSVLQPLELELEKLEVHDGLPAVVLLLPLVEPFDSKHRRSASVRPSDFDRLKLPSPHEHVGAQEEVIGLDQGSTSFSREPAPSAPNPRDVPVPWSSAGASLGLRPEGRSSLWMEWEEIDYSEDSRLRILFLIPGSPTPGDRPRLLRRRPLPSAVVLVS
jgi:hypothetical protein